MKHPFAVVLILIGVAGLASAYSLGLLDLPTETKSAFRYEVVTDSVRHAKGLSGRSSIPNEYGMLFVFPETKRHAFWMKDMLVPIDIIWLADDGTILAIEEAVHPDSYPTEFRPPSPVRLVLETRAGEARRQGWKVGTRLALPDSQKE